MIKITYECISTNEINEMEYNTSDKDKALEVYYRLIAADPLNYKITDIVNLNEVNELDLYNKQKADVLKKVISNIKSKVNLITKNKYKHTYGNELKSYSISHNSEQTETVEKFIDSNYTKIAEGHYKVNEDVEISMTYQTISVYGINPYS